MVGIAASTHLRRADHLDIEGWTGLPTVTCWYKWQRERAVAQQSHGLHTRVKACSLSQCHEVQGIVDVFQLMARHRAVDQGSGPGQWTMWLS